MLSYQHGFHAGNHADIIKHLALVNALRYLLKKSKPITYIDTHAGAGCYRTNSEKSLKTGEFQAGVGSLNWECLPSECDNYRDVLSNYLPNLKYPGSPLIAADLLRKSDRLRVFDLHPKESASLTELFSRDKRVKVEKSDGFGALKALLPVKDGRAVVLIDPSYEVKSDYQTVAKNLVEAHKRMPTALFMIWYPVVDARLTQELIDAVKSSELKNVVQYELGAWKVGEKLGMGASGMIIVNPPWTLSEEMSAALPAIQKQLFSDSGYTSITTLKPE